MAVTAAKSGYGSTLQLYNAGDQEYISIAEIVKISGMGIERETLEATNLTSPGEWKEFIYGLKTVKQFTLEVNYLPLDATQIDAINNPVADVVDFRTWRWVLPDFGAYTATTTFSGTTCSSNNHGMVGAQPVKFTTNGSLPTGLAVRQVYWVGTVTTNSFKLYLTPAAAIIEGDPINVASGASGTNTLNSSSTWTFSAAVSGFTADVEAASVLRGQISFTVRGAPTILPA